MSRVGQSPVVIPEGVEVTITPTEFRAKGKLGELSCAIARNITVEKDSSDSNVLHVKPADTEDPTTRPIWGTMRANVNNVIQGVFKGFEKVLEVNGVGYRANVQGKTLVMILGKSHDDNLEIPEGLTVKVEKNLITISGADKQRVGAFAAKARSLRPPEPYKGKGVKYKDEYIMRKEGKKK